MDHSVFRLNNVKLHSKYHYHKFHTLHLIHHLYNEKCSLIALYCCKHGINQFDFRLYTKRSLEHINPKSWEKEEDTKLNFHESETNLSVNSIGNLILICSDDNSAFGKLDFEDKKKKYFEVKNCRWSLKLLHSVSVFSKEKWDEDSIKSNQESFLKEFKDYYSIQQQ